MPLNTLYAAQRSIVVTTPEVSSIRDADRIIGLLEASGIRKNELLINRLRVDMVRRGDMMSVEDVTEILAIDLLGEYSDRTADRVEKLENQIDQYEDALGTYLVKLSGRELSIKDSRVLSVLLHCIGDFERISDHAVNIRDAAVEMHKKDLKFSEKAKQELRVFSNAIRDILDRAVMAFETGDVELAKEVEPLEQVVDALNKEEKQRHINRLRTGTCTIELGFILSDISTNFERAADHCSNIAVCLLQVDEGGFDTHEYLDILKEENSEEFQHEYMELSERYALPESKHTGKKEKIAKTEKMEARKDSGK